MNIIFHKFPTKESPRMEIESLYCKLLNLYRNGEYLDQETIDWMDYANTLLISESFINA